MASVFNLLQEYIMENKRRCIAVITSEVCEVYQSLLLEGIKKQAAENNFNVAVFATYFSQRLDSPLNEIGENNIFNLINYDLFDGFIVVPNCVAAENVLDRITQKLLKANKPVVFIDKENEYFTSVCSNDYNSFKNIVNHLIRDHGLTRINCLTGFKGMNLSEARLQGYIDALRENNIPVEENRYDYGDFWRVAAVSFVEKMFTCGLELPQAVVCANDTMAIAVCREIFKRGLNVPEDIAVTGFDRIMEGRLHHPSISSVYPAMSEIGKKAVEVLYDAMSGKEVEKNYLIDGEFFPSESCGCAGDSVQSLRDEMDRYNQYVEHSQYFTNSIYMYENLQESSNIDELFIGAANYRHLLNDIDTFHIFLCDNWDELNEKKSLFKKNKESLGYSKRVTTKFSENGSFLTGDLGSFNSEYMFPPIFDNNLSPNMYFFFPVNFQDITFGYVVCTCTENSVTPDAICRNWIKYLSNALEHLRSNQHLKWVLKRLERISEIDSLTGVYNRTGYENRIYKVFESARDQDKDFLIIMGDLDCLKKINDNYGHAEGDNAIRIIAKAIQNSFTEDEAVARIGGDEFIMFGAGSFDEEKLKEYPDRINDYLDHYNENSSKPYIIAISLGIYCKKVSENSELKEWLDKADENMYVNKKGKIKVFQKEQ